MKDAILVASVETVVGHGLDDWTVEEVANKAHCAKGLVNYHYRSKSDLLEQTAEAISFNRQARRLAAISQDSGTSVLDNLWATVVTEVKSGWFAGWLSFVARSGAAARPRLELPEFATQIRSALTKALGLGTDALPEPPVLVAMLDGVALRLLLGEPEDQVKDAYHRLWLGILAP